ncbi:hypothetical protein [Leifsonia sp. Leaf264]|uniref:hypothetical protein n=1 Tax=Leifsonia sp. Leaf264 TaxID=1736314 RepID=UPI0006FB491D|nr:hypothetical protein [Leifsonia sp. Leaf264]KQO98873.1 hypothetical protein ASF30_12485 [Leifsonia sp. Leaf264]
MSVNTYEVQTKIVTRTTIDSGDPEDFAVVVAIDDNGDGVVQLVDNGDEGQYVAIFPHQLDTVIALLEKAREIRERLNPGS